MKKFKEKAVLALKTAILGAAVYFCATKSQIVRATAAEATERCLNVVIPSLYAMMIVAVMIAKSGITGCVPGFIRKTGRVIFGMDGDALAVFVFSMFAGYPAGAKMIGEQYASGAVSQKSAALLCGVCFGAGPAFIIGCISMELYSSGLPGRLIIISTVAANVVTAVFLSIFLRKERSSSISSGKLTINGDILTSSAVSAGKTMGELCFMIAAFSIITAMLREWGIISVAADVFSDLTGMPGEISEKIIPAILDITAISGLPADNYMLLPWICGLVSFGGICVILQISAIAGKFFSLRIFLCARLFAASVSYGICRLLMPFILRNEAIAASAVKISTHRASSPVPSVMLLLMTFMIIAEYDKLVKIQK